MTNSSPDHNTSASKTVGLVHTVVRKRFPTSAVHTITYIAKTMENRDSSLKRMCCQVWTRVRAQAKLTVLWRWLRIGHTTGRLARSPYSRSLLQTVWSEIRTFARPGVLRAVTSAVIIRFQRWIRRKFLSWRCDVTRRLPFRGPSFALPVCWRRIICLEMVFLDTLKWFATAWWVIPVWTIPFARSRSFWRSRSIDVLVKIQMFRMANCLLLLTAQLMTGGDINASFDHRKLNDGTENWPSGIFPPRNRMLLFALWR